MIRPLRWLWRVLGRRYPRLAIMALLPVTFLVTLGGLGLLTLYQDMSAVEFWTLVGFAEALTAVEIVLAGLVAFRTLRPADRWLRDRRAQDAPAAWGWPWPWPSPSPSRCRSSSPSCSHGRC